jgi:small conductance mechanosensitive channel
VDILRAYLTNFQWETVIFTGLRILLILVLFWGLMSAVRIALRRLEAQLIERGQAEGEVPSESAKRAETLVRLLRQGVIIMLWVVAGLIILREVGVEIGPILASAGIAGLAVGFGAQNLVRDVISGFFMILENQVRVGDVAVVNGTGGLVERVNFRTIVLRDLSGTVHVFPNGTVNTVANLTREWSAYVFDIGVAYKEDVDRVIGIMREVGAELRADEHFGPLMVDDIEVFGVDDFADSAVMIKGRLKTRPIKQWDVGREYRRRLKKVFDREGIEIPFPHRTLYFGEQGSDIARLAGERGKATG